jgi:hypothetical protein
MANRRQGASVHEQSFFRQAFAAWERSTSATFDALARNPFFLGSSGSGLNAVLAMKKIADQALTSFVGALGLATRHDQERTLHLLHQIEGKLEDLQFELERQQPASAGPVTVP